MENETIIPKDTLQTLQVRTPPENSWFFKHMATGEFVWNPELIKAFVKATEIEKLKQSGQWPDPEKFWVSLTYDERVKLKAMCCPGLNCGNLSPDCQCWNDE